MTYCIGVMLDRGMVFASDSRTNAGVGNIAKFCKARGRCSGACPIWPGEGAR